MLPPQVAARPGRQRATQAHFAAVAAPLAASSLVQQAWTAFGCAATALVAYYVWSSQEQVRLTNEHVRNAHVRLRIVLLPALLAFWAVHTFLSCTRSCSGVRTAAVHTAHCWAYEAPRKVALKCLIELACPVLRPLRHQLYYASPFAPSTSGRALSQPELR